MKISVIGGGTAGWIAAYFICKAQPGKHEITVVESSKLGIIGAGEGSTGTMIELLNGSYFDFSVDIEHFMKETDGTQKMGIYHKNWTGDNTGYFAPIDSSPSWYSYQDHIFKYVLAAFGKEKMHLASSIGQNFDAGERGSVSAVHFDGHKVGQFFKSICKKDGVKIIDAVVVDATVDNNQISTVVLDNGQILKSDFFIDCTGFSRLLISKLNVGWESYAEYLPVNTAMPFILEYEKDEIPLPMTGATALSAGWMWDIPLATRRGCGYVFDNNFITHEEAQAEIEAYIGKKIKPIKFIKFEAGRGTHFWKGNVLALGLSAAFVEPLEATSIHSTIIQLLIFVKEYLLTEKFATITETNQYSYNLKISRLYDSVMEFISFHYQGGRTDTPFWQSIQNKKKISPLAKVYLEKCRHMIPGFLEVNGIIGSPAASLWNWIAAGLGLITSSQAEKELQESNWTARAKSEYNKIAKNNKSYIQYY